MALIKISRPVPSVVATDPLRVALGEAIKRHDDAKRDYDKRTDAVEAAEARLREMSDHTAALSSRIVELTETAPQRIANAFLEEGETEDADMKAARADLVEAQRALASLDTVHETLSASLENCKQTLDWRVLDLEKAAAAVLMVQADSIEERMRQALGTVYLLADSLTALQKLDKGGLPSDVRGRRATLLENVARLRANVRFNVSISDDPFRKILDAFTALKIDANASLPEV